MAWVVVLLPFFRRCISPNSVKTSHMYDKSSLIIVNDDQQDATILAYLFIPNQLYMFRAMSSPIIGALDCIYSI